MEWKGILEKAQVLKPQLILWRREFHRHPETGYEEFRTAQIVAEHLQSLGLEVETGIGKTGVVGLLKGRQPGATIALRADMDALHVQDRKTDVPYASTVAGKGHLCGHDAHTSMLMGAAQLLANLGGPEYGNIKFIFQPAEEGLAGAKAMIDDGVLANPKVDAIAGLHVTPNLSTGLIGVREGIVCAAADRIVIRIEGKGGHAAYPHEGVDAIAVSAQVITALQQVVSRNIDPLQPAVVTIGKIQGGYMGTAIAPEVELEGTVRTVSASARAQVLEQLERIVTGVAQSLGAVGHFQVDRGYPVLSNDPALAELVKRANENIFGGQRWEEAASSMGAEDFAFYSGFIPSVFYRLGSSNGEERTKFPLHHPHFDLDEEALPYGTAMHAAVALSYLQDKS